LSYFLLISTSAFAEKGQPVSHKHGDRTHTHPLPNTGLNHSHNKKSPTKSSSWVLLGSTTTSLAEAKPGSFEIGRTKGGVPIASVVGQMTDKRNRSVDLYQWYVTLRDCDLKMGKLVVLDMAGVFKFDSDFVFGGSSLGSGIAETICAAYGNEKKENYNRGK
jgi:hypothetical protein